MSDMEKTKKQLVEELTYLRSRIAEQEKSEIKGKLAEKALLQENTEWEETFNNITDMVTVHDMDFNIIRANKAAEKILGLPLLNQTPTVKCFRYYHATESPPQGCQSCECLETGEPSVFEALEPHLNTFLEIRAIPRIDSQGQLIGLIHVVRDIADRKRAEELIRIRVSQQRALLENISDIAWLKDKESRFIAVNEPFGRSCGWSPADIVGKTDRDIWPKDLAERYRSDDREVLETKIGKRVEEPLTDYKGMTTWIETIKNPVFDEHGDVIGTVGIARDISERKKTEEALKFSSQKWQNSFDSIPYIMCVISKDLEFLEINKAGLEAINLSKKEIIGKKCYELVHGITCPIPECPCQKTMATGKAGQGQVEQDGRILQLSAWPIFDEDNHVSSFVHSVIDITDQKKAEQEKAYLEAQLRHQQKLESIGTLASGVAHEINNPITSILNFAELIQLKTKEDAYLSDYAQRIINDTKRVAQIVKNLLSFARQGREQHSPAYMADIVNDTLSLISAVFRKDQLKVVVDIPDDLPEIKCRSQQLQQVLMNLMTNARDALNEAYPEFDDNKVLKITCSSVKIEGESWIRTTVENHGKAIPPEIMNRIFDPFFTTKPREAGTGLGLSISFGIVLEHQGVLWVESDEDLTRFHMDLPVDNGWEK